MLICSISSSKPPSQTSKLLRKFVQPCFGVCMSMWGTFFCIFWRRRCAWLSHIWGNGWIEAQGMGVGGPSERCPIFLGSHLSFFLVTLVQLHSASPGFLATFSSSKAPRVSFTPPIWLVAICLYSIQFPQCSVPSHILSPYWLLFLCFSW